MLASTEGARSNNPQPASTEPQDLSQRGADVAGGSFEVASSGGSWIPMPNVTAGASFDFNKFEAGGAVDIFPKETPWPKLPIPPLPYPLCNAEVALSVAVEYSGGGDFGKNPNAAIKLGIAGRVLVTGEIEAGPGKAGVEGSLGVTGALTLRGTPQNWSIEGSMGYEGQVNLVGKLGWAEVRMPVCSGTIAEMTGISFGGNGARILHTRQPAFQWGNGIQAMIDFVQGKHAQAGNGAAIASGSGGNSGPTAMAA